MDIAERNAGLAPAFLCAARTDAAVADASNYKCNLIALPTLAGWRRIVMACMRLLVPVLLALGAAGCATVAAPPAGAPNEGSASYRMLDDGHMAHYQLAIGDTATGATPFQRVLPAYPRDQLMACPPLQEVQVKVIVDETGKVSDVRGVLVDDMSGMPPWPSFFAAVRTAVLQWQFNPLRINHWAADADGKAHEVDSTTKPFSLMYAFRFECHAGKTAVSSASAQR
jgi:hypothetical protein